MNWQINHDLYIAVGTFYSILFVGGAKPYRVRDRGRIVGGAYKNLDAAKARVEWLVNMDLGVAKHYGNYRGHSVDELEKILSSNHHVTGYVQGGTQNG